VGADADAAWCGEDDNVHVVVLEAGMRDRGIAIMEVSDQGGKIPDRIVMAIP